MKNSSVIGYFRKETAGLGYRCEPGRRKHLPINLANAESGEGSAQALLRAARVA
jgi:hypothetical protein